MGDYWAKKRVVVTGGGGMIGSRLAEFLRDRGANVVVMDNMSRGRYWATDVGYANFPWANAADRAACEYMFDGAHTVFNLAASVGGVYHNLSHQVEQYRSNHDLQVVPAVVAARMGVPVFIQVSSVCVYAAKYNNPAHEEDGLLGSPEKANEGYAWAKRMGEYVSHWSFDADRTRYMIVRPTNAYGTRDYFDEKAHVIPALIAKFASSMGKDDAVEVYGRDQTREFIYSDDLARGMMVVAEKGANGETYNLGTNERTTVSIGELALIIRGLVGSSATVDFISDRPTGDAHRSTDSTKAMALGWDPGVPLLEGLDDVIRWYNEHK